MMELFRNLFAPPRDLILLLLAGWLGLWLADRRARASAFGEKALDTLVFAMLIAYVLGGRLLYLAEHLASFASSPAGLVSLNVDAFDPWGALAVALLAGAAVLQGTHRSPGEALDHLVPLLAGLAVGVALSHLASGKAFGVVSNVPWSVELWGARRQPTQVYELILALLTVAVTWYWRPRARAGALFALWLALTAGSRVLVEGLRGDSTLIFGGLRLAQVIAWVLMAAALVALEVLREPEAEEVEPPAAPQPKRKRTAPGRGDAP